MTSYIHIFTSPKRRKRISDLTLESTLTATSYEPSSVSDPRMKLRWKRRTQSKNTNFGLRRRTRSENIIVDDREEDECPGFEAITSASLTLDDGPADDLLLGGVIDTSDPPKTTPTGESGGGTTTAKKDATDDEPEKLKNTAASMPDSFDSYIVVSVLTATAAFAALLDDNPDHMNSLARQNPLVHNIAVILGAICTLSGMYATVIFSFSSIYGRTAIGNGRLVAYADFLSETSGLRRKAFNAYLISLVLFIGLLIIAATDKINPSVRMPFLGFLLILSVAIYQDWKMIIDAAGPIFAPPPELMTEAPPSSKAAAVSPATEPAAAANDDTDVVVSGGAPTKVADHPAALRRGRGSVASLGRGSIVEDEDERMQCCIGS